MGSMFKDPDGKISMMRLMSFVVCLVILTIFAMHNIASMLKGGVFVSMGSSEALLIAGVLGAKAAQAFSEGKKKSVEILPDNTLPKTGE